MIVRLDLLLTYLCMLVRSQIWWCCRHRGCTSISLKLRRLIGLNFQVSTMRFGYKSSRKIKDHPFWPPSLMRMIHFYQLLQIPTLSVWAKTEYWLHSQNNCFKYKWSHQWILRVVITFDHKILGRISKDNCQVLSIRVSPLPACQASVHLDAIL